jgi:hypothetical protein
MSDAGKTTYLGRLWLAVHDKMGRLHAVGLPEQLRPLREVSNYLLHNQYPPHTRRGEVTKFVVPLRWLGRQKPVPFTLSFADYSGEEIERIFVDRDAAWTDAWRDRSTGSVGLIIFLRPNRIRRPTSTRLCSPSEPDPDAASWAHIRGEHAIFEPTASRRRIPAEDPSAFFAAELMPQDLNDHAPVTNPKEQVHPPTAIALVEALQFLRHERGLSLGQCPDPEHFRIAVIVSCWDAVPDDWRERGPDPFVETHFPLLHDFFTTNFHSDGIRFFGLSSTGGDLKDEAFRQKYENSDPEQMGELVYHPSPKGSPVSTPDISLPIGWLLEGEDALPLPSNH